MKAFLDETLTKGDSQEVMTAYCTDKLMLLEKKLNQLTILENPERIQHICSSIMEVKAKLLSYSPKKALNK
jgi:hypothetical protein